MGLCLALCAAGCLSPTSFSLEGHACKLTADCGAGLTCDETAHCASSHPPDAALPTPPSFPIRAATYTTSFPYFWSFNPHETPSAGLYDTADAGVVMAQVKAMQWAGIQVGLYHDDGNGSQTDVALLRDLDRVRGTNFFWALYYEKEDEVTGGGGVPERDLEDVLREYQQNVAKQPNLLHLDGGFVVFVHSAYVADPCEVASRYVTANRNSKAGAYLVLRAETPVTGKYLTCALQPNAWFQFNEAAPVVATRDAQTLSPGEFQYSSSTPQAARDLGRFTASLQPPLDAGVKFQIITSFNDWVVGSEVESAVQWPSDSGYGQYLDALHDHPLRTR